MTPAASILAAGLVGVVVFLVAVAWLAARGGEW